MYPAYTPPEHTVGDTVLFYLDGDPKKMPLPAIITTSCGRQVDLLVFESRRATHKPLTGIRHINDPAAQDANYSGRGCWDHRPQTKRIMALESMLASMDKQYAQRLHDPLPELTIEQLRSEAYTAGIELPPIATKPEIARAVHAHRVAKQPQ